MADLIQCPDCGLRQSGRHAYCARCEYRFTGAANEAVTDDRPQPSGRPTGSTPTGATPTGPTPTTGSPVPSAGSHGTPNPSTGPGGARGGAAVGGAPRPVDLYAGLDDSLGGIPAPDPPGSARRDGPSRLDDLPPRSDSIRASGSGDRLVADRGSLGRRLSQPAVAAVGRDDLPGEGLPNAPAWEMPGRAVRRSHPLPDTEESPDPADPAGQADAATSGSAPDFVVRGRPQDELYASEHSIPPEDPLLADLVQGRLDVEGFGPSDLDDQPPVHATFGDVPAPIEILQPGAPRVAPPSLGSRRSTSSARRVDPRGRSVASAPEARDLDPATAYIPPAAFGFEEPPEPALLVAEPARPRPSTAAGVRAPPRPAPSPRAPDRGAPASVRTVVARLAFLLALGVGLLAAVDILGLMRARAALTTVVEAGIGPDGPTPDLPVLLRERLAELNLERAVLRLRSELLGASNEYRIGAELRSTVAAVPIEWAVVREGRFEVERRIRTLQVYVAAGWELDADGLSALTAYNDARRTFRTTEALEAQARALGDDDDSAAPPAAP